MRGHSCSLGGYDGCNCYVGTPPIGSTAFIITYPDGSSYFMYTPTPPFNTCPLLGSQYDGANCMYLLINPLPVSDAFVYNNNWYMRPDLIPGYLKLKLYFDIQLIIGCQSIKHTCTQFL